jgi:hypothetical protein
VSVGENWRTVVVAIACSSVTILLVKQVADGAVTDIYSTLSFHHSFISLVFVKAACDHRTCRLNPISSTWLCHISIATTYPIRHVV